MIAAMPSCDACEPSANWLNAEFVPRAWATIIQVWCLIVYKVADGFVIVAQK